MRDCAVNAEILDDDLPSLAAVKLEGRYLGTDLGSTGTLFLPTCIVLVAQEPSSTKLHGAAKTTHMGQRTCISAFRGDLRHLVFDSDTATATNGPSMHKTRQSSRPLPSVVADKFLSLLAFLWNTPYNQVGLLRLP